MALSQVAGQGGPDGYRGGTGRHAHLKPASLPPVTGALGTYNYLAAAARISSQKYMISYNIINLLVVSLTSFTLVTPRAGRH